MFCALLGIDKMYTWQPSHNSQCTTHSVGKQVPLILNNHTPLLLFSKKELNPYFGKCYAKHRCIWMPRTLYLVPQSCLTLNVFDGKNLQCLILSLSHIQLDWKNNDDSFFDLSYFILVFTNEHNIITLNHPQTCVFWNHPVVTLTKNDLCCLSVNHSGDQELVQMQKRQTI